MESGGPALSLRLPLEAGLSHRQIGPSLGWSGIGELSLDPRHCVFHGETVFAPEIIDVRAVLDELIGPANHDQRGGNSLLVKNSSTALP